MVLIGYCTTYFEPKFGEKWDPNEMQNESQRKTNYFYNLKDPCYC